MAIIAAQQNSHNIPTIQRVFGEEKTTCFLFVGMSGKMYHMTVEEREKEDLGFFHGFKILSNHTPQQIVELWSNATVNAQFRATEDFIYQYC
jgi:hypothetical protein